MDMIYKTHDNCKIQRMVQWWKVQGYGSGKLDGDMKKNEK
jgi:hypothetical protein